MSPAETMKKLNALYERVDSVYRKIAEQNDLSYNELMMLYMVEEDSELTQKKVGDVLNLPKSSVHVILMKLIRQGLLELTTGSNKKEKYIAATLEGQSRISKIRQETDRIESGALLSLPQKELSRFVKTAGVLVLRMQQETEELYGE